jgi:diguanylate cyclase (GGDEF)-like protein
VYRDTLRAAQQIAQPAAAAIYTPGPAGALACREASGGDGTEPAPVLDAHHHAAARALRTGQHLVVSSPLAENGHGVSPEAGGPGSIGFLPIVGDAAPVGVLALAWDESMPALSDRLETTLGLLCHEAAAALDRVSLLERLDTLARTDPLTGLANRRVWDEELAIEISRARREGRPLMVGILDLDRFKRFNDSRGHAAGDRMLRTLAAAFSSQLRETDTIARLGGEEFGVIAPGCDRAQAEHLLSRLREAVPEAQTCSAGFAIWEPQEDADSVFKRADDALYEAKRAGRDRSCAAPAAGVGPRV